jgi:RNA polymerase sigma factor (sigma-70 family)
VRTTLVVDAADASALHGGAASPSGRRRASVSSADPPDAELVRRIGAGDQPSMAMLYDRYARQSYSLARRICADDGIAQDVVQEAFLAFWRDTTRFDPTKGSFGTWLLTLVHHKSVDAVRRESALRKRTVPASEDGDDWSAPPGPGADQAAIGAVVAEYIQDALGRLPEEQRKAILLAYYRGYTQREVAAITGVPLGTVKSRMFTGLQRLRGLLGPLVLEPAAELSGPNR